MNSVDIMSFDATCPDRKCRHRNTHVLTQDDVETALDKQACRFFCVECGKGWNATPADLDRLRDGITCLMAR